MEVRELPYHLGQQGYKATRLQGYKALTDKNVQLLTMFK